MHFTNLRSEEDDFIMIIVIITSKGRTTFLKKDNTFCSTDSGINVTSNDEPKITIFFPWRSIEHVVKAKSEDVLIKNGVYQ